MSVLPLFYPRKAKNAVTCSVTTFREILKVVPPGIEHIICPVRKCLMYSVLTYLKIIETTESD